MWAKKAIAVVMEKAKMSDHHTEHLQTPEMNSRTEMDFVSQKSRVPMHVKKKIHFPIIVWCFSFSSPKVSVSAFFHHLLLFSSVVCTFTLCGTCLFKLFRKRRSRETGCLAYSHILAQSTSPHWTLHRSQLSVWTSVYKASSNLTGCGFGRLIQLTG